jgi:hypothetical protein
MAKKAGPVERAIREAHMTITSITQALALRDRSAKLDVAIILAAIAALVLIIEHKQQIYTDAPMSSVLTQTAAACPDQDNVPYTPACIAFLTGPNWAANRPEREAGKTQQ